MAFSFVLILLSLIALSFLIFIHELGHYLMARKVGMKVETFSIGFGKPIISWVRDGVTWQIGWLFFGGFVKIAGQEMDGEKNPYEIENGFFGKSPWDRIKVAFAGPLMNLVFAFILFTTLWVLGGREKNFSEYTPKIGWVDPKSELYEEGVRPGDEIVAYDDKAYQSSKDHLVQPMTASEKIDLAINKVDYPKKIKTEKKFSVKVYSRPDSLEPGILTSGILQPASYVINKGPLPPGSPLAESGIQEGDRILWVDGQVIFSLQQLNKIINDDRILMTIERNGKQILRRVPRVPVEELKLNPSYREEIVDWQYEAGLNQIKTRNLYSIPYDLNSKGEIEEILDFIDKEKKEEAFPEVLFSELEEQLITGDRIIAINGQKIEKPWQILELLQDRKVNIIVQRDKVILKSIPWQGSDDSFQDEVNWKDLEKLISTIGSNTPLKNAGNLYLLNTVTPKRLADLKISEEAKAMQALAISERKKMIDEIQDPEKKAFALGLLENQQNQFVLGLLTTDRKITYNPNPFEMFRSTIEEIGHTLSALFTGTLNPKWMSGPVGIIHMVHDQSFVSIKESLFWIGLISLNLGILNLLPIPVLDGGTILFSLYELVSGKRIQPKTLEKLIIPFAILLICFFIFLTYNDLMRLFAKFFF